VPRRELRREKETANYIRFDSHDRNYPARVYLSKGEHEAMGEPDVVIIDITAKPALVST
jgi:hypothetical protein